MLQEEKLKLGRKSKDMKAKEAAASLTKEREALQKEIADKLNSRSYIPKKGTGKFYHIAIEIPSYSEGERVSITKVVSQEHKTAQQTISNASRLGYAIGFKHDASPFVTKDEAERLLDLIEGYIRSSNMSTLKYACTNLCTDDNKLNTIIKKMYSQREKHIESENKKKENKSSYLDRDA
jgi:hypothetical protein